MLAEEQMAAEGHRQIGEGSREWGTPVFFQGYRRSLLLPGARHERVGRRGLGVWQQMQPSSYPNQVPDRRVSRQPPGALRVFPFSGPPQEISINLGAV